MSRDCMLCRFSKDRGEEYGGRIIDSLGLLNAAALLENKAMRGGRFSGTEKFDSTCSTRVSHLLSSKLNYTAYHSDTSVARNISANRLSFRNA